MRKFLILVIGSMLILLASMVHAEQVVVVGDGYSFAISDRGDVSIGMNLQVAQKLARKDATFCDAMIKFWFQVGRVNNKAKAYKSIKEVDADIMDRLARDMYDTFISIWNVYHADGSI